MTRKSHLEQQQEHNFDKYVNVLLKKKSLIKISHLQQRYLPQPKTAYGEYCTSFRKTHYTQTSGPSSARLIVSVCAHGRSTEYSFMFFHPKYSHLKNHS